MASVSLNPVEVETRFNEAEYVEWQRCFSSAVRRQMIDDDLFAGRAVPSIIAAIVGTGVILAILSVWLTG